jgi:hypothetical protein
MRFQRGFPAILLTVCVLPTGAAQAAARRPAIGPLATWTRGYSLGVGVRAQYSVPGWFKGLDLGASWAYSFPADMLGMDHTHWELEGRLTQRIGIGSRHLSLYLGFGCVLTRETARAEFLGARVRTYDRFAAPRLASGVRLRVPGATLFLEGRLTDEPPGGGYANHWRLRSSVALGLTF